MKRFSVDQRRRRKWSWGSLALVGLVVLVGVSVLWTPQHLKKPTPDPALRDTYTVFAYNDLGMHCMNQDFSELCILPPYNNLHAQVIRRGREPEIIDENVQVHYAVPYNSTSANKTNFWDYAPDLFGVALPDDIGLTGNGMRGRMERTEHSDWVATGIPITPATDFVQWDGTFYEDPFQLATVWVTSRRGSRLAATKAVVPVSWEINCNLCHNTEGISVDTDILRKHDALHGTSLEFQKPVLCAGCHADPALGTTGVAGVSNFSHAMHGSHAPRMAALPGLKNSCYACHPGVNTECQRDVHLSKGITCVDCHGDMLAVADPTRTPWVTEPTCASCHDALRPEFEYEEPGKLFKDSRGHGGVFCSSCHGPQHATGPAVTDADNVQAILRQGFEGPIRKCSVCHTETPHEPFFHSREH